MEKLHVIVDGVSMGLQKKTSALKKLSRLKGIDIITVKETEKEKAVRLEGQRRALRNISQEKQHISDQQPSLINSAPIIKAYYKQEE